LQWVEKQHTPEMMGRIISVGSFAAIITFGLVWLAFDTAGLDFRWVYLIGGGITIAMAIAVAIIYPQFPEIHPQHKKLILRRRYWLFYALEFMSGARRQIFVVFAGFLMVEKFDFSVASISALFLVNAVINMFLAPKIGRLISRIGERRALMFEYAGLICVFTAYAFVQHAGVAAVLYVIDHLFFAMAIAISTYFQKIADPADIASTAGVSFTINHIAAVVLPAVLGLLWLVSPAAVFLCGSAIAVVSFLLSLNIPDAPAPGNEVIRGATDRRTVLESAQ
jgi:predicted MFS family arabinose efflux permease